MRISSKLRWFIFILVVLTSVSIALIGYLGNSITISRFQSETLTKRSILEVDRLQLAFQELNHDIRFIANLPPLKRLMELKKNNSDCEDAKKDLADIFEQMLRAKPNYSQIRVINDASIGKESVRVDRRGDGQIHRVPEDQLQTKANRSYFIQASQRLAGEVYYSRVNLNRENGVIEFPNRPVLRVAMPIYDNADALFGIVIINLDFRPFIENVLRVGGDRSRYEYYLINEDGYFLYHSDPSYTFGFDLGVELKAEHVFPELKNHKRGPADSITFRTDEPFGVANRLVNFTKFELFAPPRELAFGIIGSYDDIGRASSYTTTAIIIAMCVLTLFALLLAIWFSSRITKPLECITMATRGLSLNEKEDFNLPTERKDEIGDLANTFMEMKGSIEKHQGHLLQANQRLFEMNRDLEHFARVASHDLREPIQRIAGLASLYSVECANGPSVEADEILSQLHLECEQTLRQLADFREFTDITHDASLIREECALQDIIASVLKEFSEVLTERKVQIEMDPLPQLSIFKNLVRVLYRNLVDNALQYAKTDGFKLKFTVEKDASGNVILGVLNSDSSINANASEKAFDLFSQLDKEQSGHGVGLAICKRIVSFHSGKIWIESEAGYFYVKFYLEELEL